MSTPSRILSIATFAMPLLWSAHSFAQSADLAKKLLDEAQKQRDAGNISAACALLDRAFELEPRDGILYARADCRDQEGKIAAAVSVYRTYLRTFARMTGATRQSHVERAGVAEARIVELEPLVPAVQFVWAKEPPADAKIIVDGIEYSASTLDVKMPLEPGQHEIVVRLPGEPERKRTVDLLRGGSTIVDLTPLSPKENESTNIKVPIEPGPTAIVPPPPPPKQPMNPWKIGGFVGVGLGAAGIIAGSVAGSLAISEKRVVDDGCGPDHRCDPDGLAAADRFQFLANMSTATFIVGGVLGGVGATLLVYSYRPSIHSTSSARLHATILPNGAYWGIEGAF